jgi:hypothetical protein
MKMLRDEKQNGRLISYVQRSASPLRSSARSFSLSRTFKNASVLKISLIVLALLFTETSFAASGNANSGGFSQKQITTFVKTVTTELELSKNWKASFANTAGSKLYCHSVVLGEGVRAGNRGLYTWFTCSAMHKLDITKTSNSALACTGFSSPVWIAPTATSINFQAVSFGPEYVAFKTSAPAPVQTLMDSTYNQMNSGSPRVLIARATLGKATTRAATQNNCQ